MEQGMENLHTLFFKTLISWKQRQTPPGCSGTNPSIRGFLLSPLTNSSKKESTRTMAILPHPEYRPKQLRYFFIKGYPTGK